MAVQRSRRRGGDLGNGELGEADGGNDEDRQLCRLGGSGEPGLRRREQSDQRQRVRKPEREQPEEREAEARFPMVPTRKAESVKCGRTGE
jgi:hypothetical protein